MSSVVQFPRKRPPAIKLGDRTRIVRRELGLTQSQFANQLAQFLPTVRDRAYGAWEAGINEPENKEEVCVALERMTGYPRTWFMGWDDNGPRPDGPDGGLSYTPSDLNREPTDSGSRPVAYGDFGRANATPAKRKAA